MQDKTQTHDTQTAFTTNWFRRASKPAPGPAPWPRMPASQAAHAATSTWSPLLQCPAQPGWAAPAQRPGARRTRWVGSETTLWFEATKFWGIRYEAVSTGDRSAWRGPSSHSERPVESEARHIGPTPTDRFSHGESGPHCT